MTLAVTQRMVSQSLIFTLKLYALLLASSCYQTFGESPNPTPAPSSTPSHLSFTLRHPGARTSSAYPATRNRQTSGTYGPYLATAIFACGQQEVDALRNTSFHLRPRVVSSMLRERPQAPRSL